MDTLFWIMIVGIGSVALLVIYRVIQGPTVYDRLNGLIVIASDMIIILVLIGYILHRIEMFIDIAVFYAITGFITLVVLAKHLDVKEKS
jgi:multicomponent Na+:H+ antiporter subunit F